MSGATKLSNWLDNGSQLFTKNSARSTWLTDDQYYSGGNVAATPDWGLGWNTAQTVDALYLGLSAGQNTFVIGEYADRAFDFAHGAQTNPTVFIHSAAQSTTEALRLNYANVAFLGAGLATTATEYSIGRNADATNRLQFNVPAGAIHEISVNDVAVVLVTATTLQTLLGSAVQPSMVSLADTNTGLYWTGSDVLGFSTGGAGRMTVADSAVVITQGVATSGSPVGLTFIGGAHTTLAAGASAPDISFQLNRTVQFATGALTTQSAISILPPTYGFVDASTISNAETMRISGPPQAGTNATITTAYGLVIGEGGTGYPVNSTSATMLLIRMPDIANGVGAMSNLIGLQLASDGAQLGNQTATLDFFAGVHLLGVTLTSDTNVRTVTTAATLRVAGPPVASTNVVISGPSRAVNIGGGAVTTGTAQELLVSTGAHTGMTLSTEASGISFDLSATKQWATGDITNQREFQIQAPTYGFVEASTIAVASTIWVNRPPWAGTNATLTSAASFRMGVANASANAGTSSHLFLYPLAIRNGYGLMTTLAGLIYSDGGAGVSLGNVTNTLTNLNAIRLDAITYTSTTLVRTVTNPATLYIGGAPVAGGNVTFSNEALAFHVDSGTTRLDGHLDMQQTTAPTSTLTDTTLNAGAGAGASIVVTAGSTDMHGRVTITAGNGTPTAGIAGQIVFNAVYNSAPSMVLFGPGDTDYWDVRPFVTSIGTTSFEITFKTAATTSQVIVLEYWVVQ